MTCDVTIAVGFRRLDDVFMIVCLCRATQSHKTTSLILWVGASLVFSEYVIINLQHCDIKLFLYAICMGFYFGKGILVLVQAVIINFQCWHSTLSQSKQSFLVKTFTTHHPHPDLFQEQNSHQQKYIEHNLKKTFSLNHLADVINQTACQQWDHYHRSEGPLRVNFNMAAPNWLGKVNKIANGKEKEMG